MKNETVPSMFSITGRVENLYTMRPVDSDGNVQVKHKVQLLGSIPVEDGARSGLIDLSIKDPHVWQSLHDMRGKLVCIPFGYFSPARGQVVAFVPKGAEPVLLAG